MKRLLVTYLILIIVLQSTMALSLSSSYRLKGVKLEDMPSKWFELLDRNRNYIDDTLEKMIGSDEIVRAVVGLSTPPTKAHIVIVESLGGKVVLGPWSHALYGFAIEIPANKISLLRDKLLTTDVNNDQYSDLLYISLDRKMQLHMHYAARQANIRPILWNLGYTGKYVSIAVIDTGVDVHAPGLRDAIIYGADATGTNVDPFEDPAGHGTAVTYILVGRYNGSDWLLPLSTGLQSVPSDGIYFISQTFPVYSTGTMYVHVYVTPYNPSYTYTAYLLKVRGYGNLIQANDANEVWIVAQNSTWDDIGYDRGHTLITFTVDDSSDYGNYVLALEQDTGGYVYTWSLVWTPSLIEDDVYNLSTGLVPDASVIMLRVLDSSGNMYDSYIVNAIDIAIANRDSYNISVISMSLGGPGYSPDLEQATRNAVKNGIVVIASAGNNGTTTDPNGDGPGTRTYPAAFPWVISVAAVDGFNNITDYSSQGGYSQYDGKSPKPNIAAMGANPYGIPVHAADSNNESDHVAYYYGWIYYDPATFDLEWFAGTSAAAPMVAGIAAQIVQVFREKQYNSTASLWERMIEINGTQAVMLVRDILEASAYETYPLVREYNGTDWSAYSPTLERGGWDRHEGFGVVDAYAAVMLAEKVADLLLYWYGVSGSYEYEYGPDDNIAPFISYSIDLRKGTLYNAPDIPYTLNFPFGNSVGGLAAHFERYVWSFSGDEYPAIYGIRVIAGTTDPSNTDFDAHVYIFNTSTWDIDLWNHTSGGYGDTDEIFYLSLPETETDPGTDYIYYVTVKRATEASAGGKAKLYIGPGLEAEFRYGRYIWVNATAVTPNTTAKYALIMVTYTNASGNYVHVYAIAPTEDLNGFANVEGYIDIGWGLQDDWDWYVGVLFTKDPRSPLNLTHDSVVEGPVVVPVTIGEPTVLTLSVPATVYDHESFDLAARLIDNDTGSPIVGETIHFYRSTDLQTWTEIGTATTNSTGYAVLSWNEPDNGTYYYVAIYYGDSTRQYSQSYGYAVQVYMRTSTTITASETNPYTMEPVTITAKLTEQVSGEPIAGEQVTIWISYDGGSTWVELFTGTTDSNGEITYTHLFISAGTYVLKANYSGNAAYLLLASESSTVSITSVKTPTTASITHNGTDLRVYDKVAFTVQLNYTYDTVNKPVDDATVYLELWDGASWSTVATGTTDSNGYVTLFYTFTHNGTYDFRIHYSGNDTFVEYISPTYTLSVLSLNTTTNLVSYPSSGYVGQTLTATVEVIDEKSRPVANGKVSLMKWSGTDWINVTTAYTGADGRATLSWSESSEGTYTYKVVYEGKPYVYNASESATFTVTIQALATGLTLSANVSSTYINKTFLLTAQLVSDGSPVAGETIEFQYWDGSSWVTLGTNTTDANGYAYYHLSERYAGNYTYRAYYPGSPQYEEAVSDNVSVEVKPLPTQISVSAPSTAYVSQYITVTIHLELAPPYTGDLANEPVKLWISSDGSTWSLYGEYYTGSDGTVSITMSFSSEGTYYLKANYTDPGKATGQWEYDDSESTVVTITVSKVSTTLELTANTTTPYAMETIEFIAYLTRDNDTVAIEGALIELQKWDGASWVTVATAYTNSTGYAVFYVSAGYVGTYQYRAVYSGSNVYESSTSSTITIDTQPIPTQLTLVASATSVSTGETFTLEATLINTLNGSAIQGYTVKFWKSTDGTTWTYIGEATTGADGKATFTWSETVAGTYYYKANFTDPGKDTGTQVYGDSESNTVTVSVGVTPTQLTLSANVSETIVGKRFKLIAYLETTDGTPVDDAVITFQAWDGSNWVDIGTATTNATGYAVLEHYEDYAANYTYRAVYSGNSTYGGSTSNSVTLEVKPKPTTITISGPSAGYTTEKIRFTATLTTTTGEPVVGYTVKFWISTDGSTWTYIGGNTTDSSGTAELNYVFWVYGTYYVKANFTDPGKDTGSWVYDDSESTPITIDIQRMTVTLTLTVNNTSPYINETVEFIVQAMTASGKPLYPADLVIYLDSSNVGTVSTNSTGYAIWTNTSHAYSIWSVYVEYLGNDTYAPATSNTVTVTWNPLPVSLTLTASPSTVTVGQSFTLTVYMEDTVYHKPVNGYTVKFWRSIDGVTWECLGEATLVNGYASITTSESSEGIYYYKVNFTDPNKGVEEQWIYQDGESNTVEVNVTALPGTVLTLSANTSSTYVGYYVRLTARLTEESTGNPLAGYEIKFYVYDGVSWSLVGTATTNSTGYAWIDVTASSKGTYTYKAVFEGTPEYSGSESNNVSITYIGRPVTIELVSIEPSEPVVGETITIKARLTSLGEPVVNKYVELRNATATLDTGYTGADGVVTFTISFSEAGNYTLYIVSPADTVYEESTLQFNITVKNNVSITLTINYEVLPNGSVLFTFIAKLLINGKPFPGQTVAFYKKGSWIYLGSSTTNSSGIAVFTYLETDPQPTMEFRANYTAVNATVTSASTIQTIHVAGLIPAPEPPILSIMLLTSVLVLLIVLWIRRRTR